MLKCKEYLSNKKKKKTVKARLLCNSWRIWQSSGKYSHASLIFM
jgi:hypothetical protein